MRTCLASPRAVGAVVALFAYNGLVFGVYAASIPILREKIGLDPIRLAVLFVVTGVAAIAAMQVSGRVSDRYGARRVCLVTIVPLAIAAIGYATVGTYPALLVAGVFLGIGNGGVDVAMNALAVQVERHRVEAGRGPIMSFFHGMWAVGSFAGSLAVSSVGTGIGLAPNTTLLVCGPGAAGVGVAMWVLAYLITPNTEPVIHESDTGEKLPIPKGAYLLGLMAIGFALGEGTASDWAGTHALMVAQVDPRTASWAVTALMACIVVIRLSADRLIPIFGRRRLVRVGASVAICGYAIVTLISTLPLLILGWALIGLGMGVIAPQVYAAAGHLAGGRGLAVVVSFGYATFLIGPAVIGALIHVMGIQHAMAIPGALLIFVVLLAGKAMGDSPTHL